MVKIAGILFVVCSAGSVGLKIASALRKRCKLLRQLLQSLQILHNEIACCGTPLPQAFALMAVSTEGALSSFFSEVAKTMDKHRWMPPANAMEEALKNKPLFQEDEQVHEVLLSLGNGLGRYDREKQLLTLETAKVQLETVLHNAEQECSVRSKTYEVLGICAGISVVILLL